MFIWSIFLLKKKKLYTLVAWSCPYSTIATKLNQVASSTMIGVLGRTIWSVKWCFWLKLKLIDMLLNLAFIQSQLLWLCGFNGERRRSRDNNMRISFVLEFYALQFSSFKCNHCSVLFREDYFPLPLALSFLLSLVFICKTTPLTFSSPSGLILWVLFPYTFKLLLYLFLGFSKPV